MKKQKDDSVLDAVNHALNMAHDISKSSLDELISDYGSGKFMYEDLKKMELDYCQPFVSKMGNRITWKSNNVKVIAKAKVARGCSYELEFEYHLCGEHISSHHVIGI